MNIAIVDDSATDRLRLEQILQKYAAINQPDMHMDYFTGGEVSGCRYVQHGQQYIGKRRRGLSVGGRKNHSAHHSYRKADAAVYCCCKQL